MARRTKKPPSTIGLDREADPFVRSRPHRRRNPAQPDLPFDPFPDRIEPCLAKLAYEPPVGPEWAFEVKWDGYRLAVHRNGDAIRLLTRGGHDWTHRFPSVARAVAALDATTIVLDGEAVVLDDQGRSDFNALQRSLGGRGGEKVAGREVVFYAFDLLYADGHDLTGMALDDRRMLLEEYVSGSDGAIRLSQEIAVDGKLFLSMACELGLEGVIAKRRDRRYRSGRGGEWLKVKCVTSETFALVGYEPSTKVRSAIASLQLAARREGEWVHVGSVGTGFSMADAAELKERLDALRVTTSITGSKRKGIVHAKPELLVEIEFRAWTEDGKLRHASFKGLREVADAARLYELLPSRTANTVRRTS